MILCLCSRDRVEIKYLGIVRGLLEVLASLSMSIVPTTPCSSLKLCVS